MRKVLIIILLFGCEHRTKSVSDKESVQDSHAGKLYSLLMQLPELKVPLTFRSNKEIPGMEMSDSLIHQIQSIEPRLNPYGKIYETEKYIAIIAIGASDVLIPVLVTVDKNGVVIDSFSMYQAVGGDIGYYPTNIVTLTKNKELFFTDSILHRKTNSDGSEEIPGTDSVAVNRKTFRVDDSGHIIEVTKVLQ
jgi:hypothetical protein